MPKKRENVKLPAHLRSHTVHSVKIPAQIVTLDNPRYCSTMCDGAYYFECMYFKIERDVEVVAGTGLYLRCDKCLALTEDKNE